MAQASATRDEGFSLALGSLEPLHWAGIVLSAITGVIHLVLAALFVPEAMGVAFLVAGLGYALGIAAVVVDYRRRLFYLLGIPFTLGQIVAWYVVNAEKINAGTLGPLDVVDKTAQVLLVGVLVVLYRRAQ
jgi:hypothetical protein